MGIIMLVNTNSSRKMYVLIYNSLRRLSHSMPQSIVVCIIPHSAIFLRVWCTSERRRLFFLRAFQLFGRLVFSFGELSLRVRYF